MGRKPGRLRQKVSRQWRKAKDGKQHLLTAMVFGLEEIPANLFLHENF